MEHLDGACGDGASGERSGGDGCGEGEAVLRGHYGAYLGASTRAQPPVAPSLPAVPSPAVPGDDQGACSAAAGAPPTPLCGLSVATACDVSPRAPSVLRFRVALSSEPPSRSPAGEEASWLGDRTKRSRSSSTRCELGAALVGQEVVVGGKACVVQACTGGSVEVEQGWSEGTRIQGALQGRSEGKRTLQRGPRTHGTSPAEEIC